MGEVCLGEMEMGMQSAVRLGWKISGARRTGGTWPQVPTAWVRLRKGLGCESARLGFMD